MNKSILKALLPGFGRKCIGLFLALCILCGGALLSGCGVWKEAVLI